MTLSTLLAESHAKQEAFESLVASKFPGCSKWHWYRALSAVKGEICQRNADTSNDAALAADVEIEAAHDAWIAALHRFYGARDGKHGVLGGRGL